VLASSIIAAIAVATARETYRVPLRELDGRKEASAVPAPREPKQTGVVS
jgi:hypothetical protein